MISSMLDNARAKAEHTARTAGIGMLAGLAILAGLAFWTAAGWFFLLTVTTPLNASLILGALYTGAGLIGFGIVSMRSRKAAAPRKPAKAPEATLESLVSAFITGLNAGARTRS